MSGHRVQRVRLGLAVAIVAAVVFAVPAADAFMSAGGGEDAATVPQAALRAESVLGASSAEEALGALEGIVVQAPSELPDWFLAEVGTLPGARDVRVACEGKVVGYVVDCDVAEALASLEGHMGSLGWTAVSLGQVDGFTFMKPSGRCMWALVTCTQVDGATSVVCLT